MKACARPLPPASAGIAPLPRPQAAHLSSLLPPDRGCSLQVLSRVPSSLVLTTDFCGLCCYSHSSGEQTDLERSGFASGSLMSKRQWLYPKLRDSEARSPVLSAPTGTLVLSVMALQPKQKVFLGAWFAFKTHQPVEVQLDISPT